MSLIKKIVLIYLFESRVGIQGLTINSEARNQKFEHLEQVLQFSLSKLVLIL